jgi:acyl-CoA reductase-like NAD-dependent aldehyde dehydrogenase
MSEEIPLELTLQIGRYVFPPPASTNPVDLWQLHRPVSQVAGEIRGTLERAKYMLSIAESSLADVSLQDTDTLGFRRFIRRTPLGVVLVIAPWK